MSKRKMLTLISLGIFLLYIVSCVFLWLSFVAMQAGEFREYARNKYNTINQLIMNYDMKNDIRFDLYSSEFRYPAVFALSDSDGNVTAKSTYSFEVNFFNETEPYKESIIIDVGKYMTDEIYDSIVKLPDNVIMSYNAESLSLCKDGDDYIPVEASFILYNTDKKLVIRFTDRTPDITINDKDGSYIVLNGYFTSDKLYRKQYKKLCVGLDSHISEFRKTHEGAGYFSGSGFSDSSTCQYETHFIKNGKKYCLYYDTRTNNYYDALTSDQFMMFFSEITVVFIIVSAVLSIVISKLYDKNQRLNRSREVFINAAAHELKTPIAVIANKCECVLENIAPEKNGEYVNSIYNESKRMSRMVNTLLQYNRLSSVVKAEHRRIPLSEIISEQTEKYLPLIEAKNIVLVVNCEEKCYIKCTPELISLAIDNYLSNAVKFTPQDGKIEITVLKVSDAVRFEIFNSGNLIPEEDAPHIWEELYSGNKARTRTDYSTGMGLAVCRRIFELHKFEYGFNNVSSGVNFYFIGK